MKNINIYKLVLLAVVMLFTSACKDDFLEKLPLEQATESNFFRNEEDAIAAINSAYDVLQFELTPSGHFRWFFGDIVSDDTDKGGSGDNDVAALGRLENFQGRPTNELLESEWNANFQGIYRANLVLERVPDITMDEDLKARILGEARFIRAYFYFSLVTTFGDVPLLEKVISSPSEYNIERSAADNIWALIENDLVQAVDVLPHKSEYEAADLGRITKGAANALLLKTYVYQSKWTEAVPVGDAIIGSGEYQLDPDYNHIFTTSGEHGSGSVFEISYMPNSNGDWGNFREGTLTNVFQRARGEFGGYGFNLPTQNFVDEFEANDPRLVATVFQVGDVMGDRGEFTKEATGLLHDYYSRKYFSNKSEEPQTGDPNVNGHSNDRVIRYADVLLLHAEAAYQTGNEVAALSSLNMVRERARGGNANILPDVTATGNDLLLAIWHERRVELGLEGHRFFDLVRQGRAGDVMRAHGKSFVDGTHEVFPIPLSQIQATNGVITQNPGY